VHFSCLGALARHSKTGLMELTGLYAQAWWQDQVLADHLLGVALSVMVMGAAARFFARASMAARNWVSTAGFVVAAALVQLAWVAAVLVWLAGVVAAIPQGWAMVEADPGLGGPVWGRLWPSRSAPRSQRFCWGNWG
jgi:hypothetical protein